MRFSTVLLAVLPLTALAVSARGGPSRRQHAKRFHPRANNGVSTYTLTDFHQGDSFFDGFDFFNAPDPTHGFVEYVDQGTAVGSNLAYVQSDNTTVLAVDNVSYLAPGANRKSVRISSKARYSTGLVVADIFSMPFGCSVWPAFWMVGDNWPNNGEIDIIEGVNQNVQNQMTLHTGPGCNLDPSGGGKVAAFTAQVGNPTCASSGSDNTGCAFFDTSKTSYGSALNAVGGGVFATLIEPAGISIWRFSRNNVPADLKAQNPNPASWGTPTAFWSSSGCDISSHFIEMSIVFDTTICGDWAGAVYSQSGCPGSCSSAVADPRNFDNALWKINYVAVYQ